jgi:hypothetical protein
VDYYRALAKAEGKAEQGRRPVQSPTDPVARDGLGRIHTRSGEIFTPGIYYDQAAFQALPLI